MRTLCTGFAVLLVAMLVRAVVFTSVPSPTAQALAQQGSDEEQYTPVRKEIPAKCDCGCGRDFLDCDHDCPSLDTISSKKQEELGDPVEVRSEVPREAFPKDQWVYGVKITKVFQRTPATDGSTRPGRRGNRVILEPGDIITHINGASVKGVKDYYELMNGNAEKRVTVLDWKDKVVHFDYFRPEGGRIGIKFQPVRFKISIKDRD